MSNTHLSPVAQWLAQWSLEPPPVGVRLLASRDDLANFPIYYGVSYCEAVDQASQGHVLRIFSDSLQVCQWAPVVLGLKEPWGRFEESLRPRLAHRVPGLVIGPLALFPGKPQIVIMRSGPATIQKLLDCVSSGQMWNEHGGRLEWSAIPFLSEASATSRQRLVGTANRTLAALGQSTHWQALTRWLFRSRLVTAGFDTLISRTLADMSVCRNSTVIPLLSSQVNVSYFCAGGITWGRNNPRYLTSGWPYATLCAAVTSRLAAAQASPLPGSDSRCK